MLSAKSNGYARGTAIPVSGALVREALPELTELAERLLGGGPLDVRGVAAVRALIGDGSGPPYKRFCDPSELRATLSAALDSLDVAV
jgi:hypothetical protein